jgi:hypothetical protein
MPTADLDSITDIRGSGWVDYFRLFPGDSQARFHCIALHSLHVQRKPPGCNAMQRKSSPSAAGAAEAAFAEVERMSGSQFDPKCAAAFLAIPEGIVEAMRSAG